MISRVHQKLGTAGFIISVIALVAALGGGAYAASGGLTGKQKKEVEKIAKKYAGKPGANGTNGTNGATGPAGSKGDAGSAGADGKQGPEGKQGPKGPEGPEGPEGSPWTLGGTLPSGATETGTWSATGLVGAEVPVPISFPIPLSNEILGGKAHLVPATGEGTCTGNSEEPAAPKGELCIYKTEFTGATSGGIWDPSFLQGGAGPSGAFLLLEGLTSTSQAYGTWAVTER